MLIAHPRRIAALAIPFGVLLAGALLHAQQPAPETKRLSRVDRLEAWVAAVDRHRPGMDDEAVREVRTWSRSDLQLVWNDVRTVLSLIREPSIGLFFTEEEWRPQALRSPVRPRNRQILYSRDELRRLRLLAGSVTRNGGENRLLKRGALLHADISMLAPVEDPASTTGDRPSRGRTMLYLIDGRPLGISDPVNHWIIGGNLLGKVLPNPAVDEIVRLWYLAGAMFMQTHERFELWHFERALETFPKDPDILFFNGVVHETLAGVKIQAALRAAIETHGQLALQIDSEEDELRTAERLYRRALEQNANLAEARIHLGRVLSRLGRHRDAAAELRRALPSTKNALLQYYGTLFLGAAVEAQGNREEARPLYEQAASLYPSAQSPRLALSRLDAQRGDLPSALATIQTVLRAPDGVDRRDDPWWYYYAASARGVDQLWASLREKFQTGALQ